MVTRSAVDKILNDVIDNEYIKLLSDKKKHIDLANYEDFSIIEKEIMDKYNKLLKILPKDVLELFKEFDEQVSWLRALESNFTFEEGFKMGMKFFNK